MLTLILTGDKHMKSLNILLATLMLGSATALAGDCNKPASPELPDGANASMEEMLAGQQAVKAFQTENLEYMDCLENRLKAKKKTFFSSTNLFSNKND